MAKGKGGKKGGGGSKKTKSKTSIPVVEKKAPKEDYECLEDKLNEALILDDSTEIVLANSGNNNNNNNEKFNKESTTTAILTKTQSQGDTSLSSTLSPEVKPFIPSTSRLSKSRSFGDSSPCKNLFEPPFKIHSTTYHRNSSRVKPSSVVEEEINKSTASEDGGVEERKSGLLRIEDYVSLGVSREIAETHHPLEHRWTFWYFLNDKRLDWYENLVDLATVGTIEEFWQVYNHIEPASRISVGCDYWLFKYGIKPDWSDERNKKGGRWIVEMPISSYGGSDTIDRCWLETLFILIGEHGSPYNDIVNGAVINIRKGKFKIGVWLRDGRDNLSGVNHIGALFKESLGLTQSINYTIHSEEQSRGRNSSRKLDRSICL